MSRTMIVFLVLCCLLAVHAVDRNCTGRFLKSKICSKSCGGGEANQTWTITKAATGNGTCPYADGFTSTFACNPKPCPAADVNCVGEWILGNCSKSCGGGRQIDVFNITVQPSGKGKRCGDRHGSKRNKQCNSQSCTAKVDCVGEWVAGDCSKSCGLGSQTETFNITVPQQGKGKKCTEKQGAKRRRTCNLKSCAGNDDCVGTWVMGNCSKSCGTGRQTNVFNITTKPTGKGKKCTSKHGDKQIKPCNTQTCPKSTDDCIGSFVSQETCTKSCGKGIIIGIYKITQQPTKKGKRCPNKEGDTKAMEYCATQDCPVTVIDCIGSFVKQETCTKSCGGGAIISIYRITQAPSRNGKVCPNKEGDIMEMEPCATEACPAIESSSSAEVSSSSDSSKASGSDDGSDDKSSESSKSDEESEDSKSSEVGHSSEENHSSSEPPKDECAKFNADCKKCVEETGKCGFCLSAAQCVPVLGNTCEADKFAVTKGACKPGEDN